MRASQNAKAASKARRTIAARPGGKACIDRGTDSLQWRANLGLRDKVRGSYAVVLRRLSMSERPMVVLGASEAVLVLDIVARWLFQGGPDDVPQRLIAHKLDT